MAVCIGATTALFTVVRSVLLRPLPFRDPERRVMVYEHFRSNTVGSPYNPVASGDFYDWRAQTHGFEDMAAWQSWSFNVSGDNGELPEVAEAAAGSWNLLHVLGVEPALGRTFTESEDRVGQAPVAMLAWSLFQRRFNSGPAGPRRQVRLAGKPDTVGGGLAHEVGYLDPQAYGSVW